MLVAGSWVWQFRTCPLIDPYTCNSSCIPRTLLLQQGQQSWHYHRMAFLFVGWFGFVCRRIDLAIIIVVLDVFVVALCQSVFVSFRCRAPEPGDRSHFKTMTNDCRCGCVVGACWKSRLLRCWNCLVPNPGGRRWNRPWEGPRPVPPGPRSLRFPNPPDWRQSTTRRTRPNVRRPTEETPLCL